MRYILFTVVAITIFSATSQAEEPPEGKYVFAATIDGQTTNPTVATIKRQKDNTSIISFSFKGKQWSAPIYFKAVKRVSKTKGVPVAGWKRAVVSTSEAVVYRFNTICQTKEASSSVALSGMSGADGSLRGVISYHFGVWTRENSKAVAGSGRGGGCKRLTRGARCPSWSRRALTPVSGTAGTSNTEVQG